MGLKSRLKRLEKQAEGFFRTLTLPSGRKIRYNDEEVMAALSATIHQEGHHLLPHIRQLDPTQEVPSMIGLIRSLEESRAREQV
jgi:hypothetical protein